MFLEGCKFVVIQGFFKTCPSNDFVRHLLHLLLSLYYMYICMFSVVMTEKKKRKEKGFKLFNDQWSFWSSSVVF